VEKRKLTARDILKDIRSGADDAALMKKFRLSAQGLQSVFNKMLKAGVVTQQELDERVPVSERTVELGLYVCPACGNIQGKEFTECPRCGFVTPEHLRAQKEGEARAINGALKKTSVKDKGKLKKIIQGQAKPPETLSESAHDQLDNGPFPEFSRLVTYCRVLGIAGLVSYILVAAGLLAVVQTSLPAGAFSLTQMLLGLLVLGLPVVVIAFTVFVTLRALAASMKVFADLSGLLVKNQ
jgi:hypothetical protein